MAPKHPCTPWRTGSSASTGLFPIAPHRALRHAAHGGQLAEREAAEELQVDQLRQWRIQDFEFLKGQTELFERTAILGRWCDIVKGDEGDVTAPLQGALRAAIIDDQTAHRPRRIGHEAVALGKRQVLALAHVQIGFVQERCRAQGDGAAPPWRDDAAPGDGALDRASQRARSAPLRSRPQTPARGRPYPPPAALPCLGIIDVGSAVDCRLRMPHLDPARWHRLSALLDQALDLDPGRPRRTAGVFARNVARRRRVASRFPC